MTKPRRNFVYGFHREQLKERIGLPENKKGTAEMIEVKGAVKSFDGESP